MMHRCCTVSVETQISSPIILSTNKAEAPNTAEVFPDSFWYPSWCDWGEKRGKRRSTAEHAVKRGEIRVAEWGRRWRDERRLNISKKDSNQNYCLTEWIWDYSDTRVDGHFDSTVLRFSSVWSLLKGPILCQIHLPQCFFNGITSSACLWTRLAVRKYHPLEIKAHMNPLWCHKAS